MEKCVVSTRGGRGGPGCRGRCKHPPRRRRPEAIAERVIQAIRDPGLRDSECVPGDVRSSSTAHAPEVLGRRYGGGRRAGPFEHGGRLRQAPAHGHRPPLDAPGRGRQVGDLSRVVPRAPAPAGSESTDIRFSCQRRFATTSGGGGKNISFMPVDGPATYARRAAMDAVRFLHSRLRVAVLADAGGGDPAPSPGPGGGGRALNPRLHPSLMWRR